MAQKKKAKSKTLGKKDLKKTKGGTLNFTVGTNSALKIDDMKFDVKLNPIDPGSVGRFK